MHNGASTIYWHAIQTAVGTLEQSLLCGESLFLITEDMRALGQVVLISIVKNEPKKKDFYVLANSR